MKYQALYRKYRPSSFNTVVGQDVIVKTLKNSLKNKKTSHAYMFSGPRGTGKTTLAKIFAKDINCLSPIDGIACENCTNCKIIRENQTVDIIEIDAASNNGVDEIREIRSKINLVPSELKYKVYIIDEVHMLSIGAFNALLKTLEEPPEHIIFILATTDLHKVPVTIISRCQSFSFKRISLPAMHDRLKSICESESVEIGDDVLTKICQCADGGLRDAIGLLDKLISYTDRKITMNDLETVIGILSNDYAYSFLEYVKANDIVSILKEVSSIYDAGKDFIVFCQDLMEILRDDLISYYVNKTSKYSPSFSLQFVQSLNQLLLNMKTSSDVRIVFEIGILSFIGRNIGDDKKIVENSPLHHTTEEQFSPILDSIISREIISTEKVESSTISGNTQENKIVDLNIDNNNYQEYKQIIINNTFVSASKINLHQVKSIWETLNEYTFDKEYGAVACFLIDAIVRAAGEKNIILSVNYDSTVQRGILMLPKIYRLLEKISLNCYKIVILTDDEWENEKKRYIQNKNNGIIYTYLNEKEFDLLREKTDISEISSLPSHSNDSFIDSAIQLFGKDIVKINS